VFSWFGSAGYFDLICRMLKKLVSIIALLVVNSAYAQIQKVEKVVDSCVSNSNFNGAVLIAKKGKIDYLKYTGFANRHYDIKFSDETRFHIFSLTKAFTAALIMQLYEQKKINLDASISAYYPEYKGEAAKKVIIRNLLTYSSGRENKDISTPEHIHEAYDNDIWGVDSFINKYLSEKLIDTPGTKFNYNNGDFILLGKIIEKIYGKSFEQVLNEQLLRPLKMSNSGFLHHKDIIKNIDEGYSSDSALKKETVDTMMTSYEKLGDVAFGFWVYPKKIGNINTIFAERQGEGYGHSANWVHLINKGITLFILSNIKDIQYLNKMRERVLAAYLGQ
jgi:CubicO group peptidase (beta-lactamase class C family)